MRAVQGCTLPERENVVESISTLSPHDPIE